MACRWNNKFCSAGIYGCEGVFWGEQESVIIGISWTDILNNGYSQRMTLDWLVYTIYHLCFLTYLTYLTTFKHSSSYQKLFVLRPRRVSSCCFLCRLELAAGFGPMWSPYPSLLRVGSWFSGQLLLASYSSNPQLTTVGISRLSERNSWVTSDFMDLGPGHMPNQFDWLITSLMTWCWAGLDHKLLQESPTCIVSTSEHLINSYWLNNKWVAGKKPAGYVRGANMIMFRPQSIKNSDILVRSLHPLGSFKIWAKPCIMWSGSRRCSLIS